MNVSSAGARPADTAHEPTDSAVPPCSPPSSTQPVEASPTPMKTDTLLYDGHCRLCSASARRLRGLAGGQLSLQSFRDVDVQATWGISLADCEKWMHLVRSDGRVERGVLAFAAALRHRWFGPLLALVRLPVLRLVSEFVYGLVSRWRSRIAGGPATAPAACIREPPRAGRAAV